MVNENESVVNEGVENESVVNKTMGNESMINESVVPNENGVIDSVVNKGVVNG